MVPYSNNDNSLNIKDAYTSIEEMPLYNFFQYRKNQDLNWFISTYTGKQKKISVEQLRDIEENINTQYYEATDDRSFQLMIQRFAKINSLQTKHYIVTMMIEVMWKGFGVSETQQNYRYRYIEQLKAHGFKMEFLASPEEDREALSRISNELQQLKTQIKILENEMKTEGAKEVVSLEKQLLMIGIALGLNYKIDSKATTVLEWIEMCKVLEEKSKRN